MVNICLNYNESVNYLDLDPLPPLFNKVRNNIFLLILKVLMKIILNAVSGFLIDIVFI